MSELTSFVAKHLSKASTSPKTLALCQGQAAQLLKGWSIHICQRKIVARFKDDYYYFGPGRQKARAKVDICRKVTKALPKPSKKAPKSVLKVLENEAAAEEEAKQAQIDTAANQGTVH